MVFRDLCWGWHWAGRKTYIFWDRKLRTVPSSSSVLARFRSGVQPAEWVRIHGDGWDLCTGTKAGLPTHVWFCLSLEIPGSWVGNGVVLGCLVIHYGILDDRW
ncbi:hypothetical protein N658DRAFT_189397 [Parathielavia hyrcaniae]|uniref:Uncharacterized protein n=1 Tax=Parathielavia hyrcaniae TaxID=113614 RepID=A0AAN6Q8C6_9PEZI|nr:hypothetical protein N658DRAFT_189397 [Parathielavia hyrcaniae]